MSPSTQMENANKRSSLPHTAATLTALMILLHEKKMLTTFFGYHENRTTNNQVSFLEGKKPVAICFKTLANKFQAYASPSLKEDKTWRCKWKKIILLLINLRALIFGDSVIRNEAKNLGSCCYWLQKICIFVTEGTMMPHQVHMSEDSC